MKRKLYTCLMASALLLTSNAFAQSIVGITTEDEIFVIADPSMPGDVSTPIAITGLVEGQTIVGTDFRPNTGELYALGYNDVSGDAQLYVLNVSTGVATSVGAAMTLDLGSGSVGFDFNPTVDRIRVTAANQANYRLHPVTGAIVATDGELTFADGDENFGITPMISASAYSNSYIGTESTTLFNYDESLNIITTQSPPNDGIQNTIGESGIFVDLLDRSIDMDIFFDAETRTNTAYLTANALLSTDLLYTIDLSTGLATSIGVIGDGMDVKDIAVTIDRTMPEVTGQIVYGLTLANSSFISFDSDNPSFIRSLMPITGVTTGQVIVGMDFRPADRELYAMGYNYLGMEYQLYTIDVATGVATAVNTTPGTIDLGLTGNVGFDFNPVPDRIRVVSASNGNNFRLNPNDGTIAATDISLSFAEGDANFGTTAHIGTVAYTNSYMGATTTMLNGLDDSTGVLVTIDPPNDGVLNTFVSDFLLVNSLDASYDMDIYYDSVSASNVAYLSAHSVTSINDNLHSIDLATGSLTDMGSIGFGVPVRDIAVPVTYTGGTTGLGNVRKNELPLAVYPNPVAEMLHFEGIADYRNITASIADMTGRVVLTSSVKDNALNVSSLPKGIYIVKLATDSKMFAPVKFVKK